MAKDCGSWTLAEHYLCALLAHAVVCQKTGVIDWVNEVRAYYGVIPIPKGGTASGYNKSHDKWQPSLDEQAQMKYAGMNGTKRKAMLRECMQRLRIDFSNLFQKKNNWMGLYLVIRDRLEDNLSQTDFFSFAQEITPDDWPEGLRISKGTFNTFSRYVKSADERYETYYDMKENPWKELCDAFWSIIKMRLLMEK